MHKIAKSSIAVLIAASLLGCASQPGANFNLEEGKFELINHPNLNVENTVDIGTSLISRKYSISHPTILLQGDIRQDDVFIPSGKLIKIGTNQLGTLYESKNFKWTGRTNLFFQTTISSTGGVIVDEEKMEAVYIYSDPLGNAYKNNRTSRPKNPGQPLNSWKLNKPVKIAKGPPHVTENEENFLQELIYSGISKNTINITYREYKGNLLRPGFTENLKYDLDESNVIGYKGSRFEIIKASNTELKYKALRHLD